jgi:DNA-binding CsgD family transcriptional regulator
VWLGRGKTAEEIATLLGLSIFTVNHYVSSTKRRFLVTSSHQVMLHAIATGQISLSEMIEF